jgi:hypothetical protein
MAKACSSYNKPRTGGRQIPSIHNYERSLAHFNKMPDSIGGCAVKISPATNAATTVWHLYVKTFLRVNQEGNTNSLRLTQLQVTQL